MGFQAQTQVSIPGGGDSTAGMMHALSGMQKSLYLNRKRQDDIKQAALNNALKTKEAEANAAYRNQLAADSAARLKLSQAAETRAQALYDQEAKEKKAAIEAGLYNVDPIKTRTDGITFDTPDAEKVFDANAKQTAKEETINAGTVTAYDNTGDDDVIKEINDIQSKLKTYNDNPVTEEGINKLAENAIASLPDNLSTTEKANKIFDINQDKQRRLTQIGKYGDPTQTIWERGHKLLNKTADAVSEFGSAPADWIYRKAMGIEEKQDNGASFSDMSDDLYGDKMGNLKAENDKKVAEKKELEAQAKALQAKLDAKGNAKLTEYNKSTKDAYTKRLEEIKAAKSKSLTREQVESNRLADIEKYKLANSQKPKEQQVLELAKINAAYDKTFAKYDAKAATNAELSKFDKKEAIKTKYENFSNKMKQIYKATYNPDTQKPVKSSFTVANFDKMSEIVSKKDSDGDYVYNDNEREIAQEWITEYQDEGNI